MAVLFLNFVPTTCVLIHMRCVCVYEMICVCCVNFVAGTNYTQIPLYFNTTTSLLNLAFDQHVVHLE